MPDLKLAIATAPNRDSLHWRQGFIQWSDVKEWVNDPANRKEAGNYILGTLQEESTVVHKGSTEPCTECHRRKDFVVSRSALTLDVDHPRRDFPDQVELLLPYASILHTTFSSTPDEPRYRLIIPTDREMAPDEYVIASSAIMQQLGEDQFDPGTTQPERYMFRPAAQKRMWFESWVSVGAPARVDELVDGFEEDLSAKPIPKPGRNKRNPFEIEGVIGAFNTAYDDLDLLIEAYGLPYERVDADRYQLVGARSQAGMGPVPDAPGLYYSHHANDPAYGKACSSFDLVRLHLFSDEDEDSPANTPVNKLPSHEAMSDLASRDPRVVSQLVGLDFSEEMEEQAQVQGWKMGLRISRTGRMVDTIHNWDLIRENDPVLALLYFNVMSLAVEVSADLPWRPVTEHTIAFTRVDRFELRNYIERNYNGFRPSLDQADSLIEVTAGRRPVNPIRDYLDGLEWDGIPRVETCLPGVEPTEYTRLVARKVMVAAVARMYVPGIKWDHTLVLYGDEGLGKSYWIDKMARGYSSPLGRLGDKDTLITMQRSWIMVSDEGYSLRKNESEEQKEFLTRTQDVFRMPYDRESSVHPRHCVVWSTTNDETFLRRQQGNRRFLIVHCAKRVDFTAMTDNYVDQVWAEAKSLYLSGESLFLSDTESAHAAKQREAFTEEDALEGVIKEYLDTPVPPDWWERSVESRVQWLNDYALGFEERGSMYIDKVCSLQIWAEALRNQIGYHRRADLLNITDTLKRMEGWRALPGQHRVPGYGPQKTFERTDEDLI